MSLKTRWFFYVLILSSSFVSAYAQDEPQAPEHLQIFISDFGIEQDALLEPPPLVGNDSGTIPELLDKLYIERREPGLGIAGLTLVAKGREALPAILDRLAETDPGKEPYFYQALVEVLSRIHASDRDVAFVEQLEVYHNNGFTSEALALDESIDLMIMTMADRASTSAMPVLWKMTMDEDFNRPARSSARLALDRIGVANPRLDGRSRITYEDNAEALLNAKPSGKHILLSLLNRELLRTGDVRQIASDANSPALRDGISVSSVKADEKGHLVIEGGYEQTYGWSLEIAMTNQSNAAVVYRYFCGDGCSGSYAGLLERVNNQWLVRYWKEL